MSSALCRGSGPDNPRTHKLTYTIAEAVVALGVGKTTIYKLIKEGKIKAIKIGARTLIPASDLHAILYTTN